MSVRDTQANQQTQADLYGAPIADLAATVRAATGLSQTALAAVLGLSAPMLSQLVSGQRIKISNPAAVARMEELMALARGTDLDTATVAAEVERIAQVQHTLTGMRRAVPAPSDRAAALALLAARAGPGELDRAADVLGPDSSLGALLREAAGD